MNDIPVHKCSWKIAELNKNHSLAHYKPELLKYFHFGFSGEMEFLISNNDSSQFYRKLKHWTYL
jgi:hypothetical protein